MYFKRNNIYYCNKDIIVNKHLWFKKDDIYACIQDGLIMGCDHIEHSEESLKDYLPFFTGATDNSKCEKVSHPSHYTWLKEKCGVEVIDITRHLDFDLGNSIKYILRAGHKSESSYTDTEKEIEDLRKAVWYLQDKINMLNENIDKE